MKRVYFHNGLIIPSPGGALVMFDEADACVKRLTAERDALQLRLNAVEEENDRLRSGWYKDESDNTRFWPEEIEALQAELAETQKISQQEELRANRYSQQLAERDALLVDIRLSGLNDERSARIDSLLSSGPYADAINKHPSLRTSLDRAAIEATLSSSAEPSADHSVEASKMVEAYELAGYEGSSGLYYSRLAAVANGEQSVEPIYRVKK